ncbi:Uncharacterised protein [Nocardia otitidiscaviarum]|uniref:Uncharacterized protein n=1 Tax=Nocardia otitidiscaviarum TaxID=1823 RepID=A0A378Y881_9NOCA|nr:hypothetical protein [Nocardia otitidiscaviarum]SUA72721.1 Uncharacterised protein [Nocardia otitidiscaviarum]
MLFDIRTIVGALLACYGLIVLVTGLTYDAAEQEAKTGGIDINQWTGIGMLIAAAVFFTWVRLRPVQVPPTPPENEKPAE